MKMTISLTVSESKRLIAKGIAEHPAVKAALAGGIVAVAKGTTNAYVAEELLGESIPKRDYCHGRTVPKNSSPDPPITAGYPDVVLRDGERVEDATVNDIIGEMRAGDVFIKGANALNYDLDQAAVLVGHPTGGTLGATLGCVVAKKIDFIVPVGLEKSIPGDLCLASAEVATNEKGAGPSLWVVPGEIFTEIEALEVLAGVDATPMGAGGVAGAQGAIWLLVQGLEEQLATVDKIIDEVHGEPPY